MDFTTESKCGIKVGIKMQSQVEVYMWDYSSLSWELHSTYATMIKALSAANEIIEGNF
ncbi:hypothetical protein [Erwinia phage FBB1]|nr:hypothetical protein [Erwinia phage FBB1]